MAADLDEGGAIRLVQDVDAGIDHIWALYPMVEGNLIALIDNDWETDENERCVTVTLIRVDDGSPVQATPDCLPPGPMTLAHDGRSMGVLGPPTEETLQPVTILDPRIATRPYGRYLLGSLPECPVEFVGMEGALPAGGD